MMNRAYMSLANAELAGEPNYRLGLNRIASYIGCAIVLAAGAALLSDMQTQSSTYWHTVLESVAMLLAFFVGAIALLRFYARKSNLFLFVGTAFIGTGLFDGYHAVVTSAYIVQYFPTVSASLIAWSWLASRVYLSLLLLLSWVTWQREASRGKEGHVSEGKIYAGVAALALACFLFFAFVSLPQAYRGGSSVHRVWDFIPALLFALTLWKYWGKGAWRTNNFEYWLVLSLIVATLSQLLYMPFSVRPFDSYFDAAHLLKIISYSFVLIGLLNDAFHLFEQADEQMVRMHSDNLQLAREVQAREEVEASIKALNETLEERVAARTDDLEQARAAALNMMEDAERQNRELRDMQRATLSLMEDSDEARRKAEEAAAEVRHYRDHLEELVEQRTDALRAVNHELEAFSYSVSHDLRAPLRSIDGFSQALVEDYEDQLDEQGKDYLGRVRAASQRMARLIDDMLNLSRLTRGELKKERVDLSALAREVEQELRAGDPDRSVDFVVEQGVVVEADPRMLRTVLDNLLGNAWKFTINKERACIEFFSLDIDGEQAFCVRDNGAGFDMQYVGKLFGAFQRLHANEEFAGSGVGLATVQRIVHRHGGRAWAEGEVDVGATMYFTL